MAKFIAQLFTALLTLGKMPIVENSGKSSHKGFDYVKIWDTKWWKSILLRDDVMIVDVKMCGYSKRPAGAADNEFYYKPTWLVMPKCEGLRLQLERQCPGLSDDHKHIRVGGYNKSSKMNRSTEAGGYSSEFCKELINAIEDWTIWDSDQFKPEQTHLGTMQELHYCQSALGMSSSKYG